MEFWGWILVSLSLLVHILSTDYYHDAHSYMVRQSPGAGVKHLIRTCTLGALAEGSQMCEGFWTAFPRQQKLSSKAHTVLAGVRAQVC